MTGVASSFMKARRSPSVIRACTAYPWVGSIFDGVVRELERDRYLVMRVDRPLGKHACRSGHPRHVDELHLHQGRGRERDALSVSHDAGSTPFPSERGARAEQKRCGGE
jgi:hypothetical protein